MHETLAYQTNMYSKGKEIKTQKTKSKWWKKEIQEVQYKRAV